MAKHKKNIFNNKWIRWGVIPIILLAFWLGLSLYYIKVEPGFTVLFHKHSADNFINFDTSEIYAEEKKSAQFKAGKDYLGIVAVRFNTFYKINDDFVLFRIKEKGSKKWFYENRYKVDQFQPNELFTFGFPVLPDSEGKTYVFEVESVQGIKNDAVAISPIEPVFITKYQYPRSEIIGNLGKSFSFFTTKIINSVSNIDFLIASIVYLMPLAIYILYQFYFQKYLCKKYIFVFIPIIIVFAQSFFVNNTNDLVVIILTIAVALTMHIYKLESSVTFAFALIFLILTPIFLSLGGKTTAENFAMWAYMLLVIGTFQAVWELKTNNKKLLSLAEFAQKIGLKKFFKK